MEQAGLAWPAYSAQTSGHTADAFGVRQQAVNEAPRPIGGNYPTSDSNLNQYFDSKVGLVDSASSTHGRHLTAMNPCDETSDHMEPMDLAALNRLLPDLDGDGDYNPQQQQQGVQASPAAQAGLGSCSLTPGAAAPRPLRRGLGSTASVDEDIFSTVGGLELGGHDLAAAAAAAGGADPSDHAGSSSGLGAAVPSAASLADLAPVDTPSRTLLVQGVTQEVSDEELRRLFAAHGDLRMLYTAAKACGLVIVGYFDLRAAMAATNALQGFPLGGRQLEVAYSAPKKGEVNQINQGVVVVYNLDPDTTNEQLVWMFSRFGEVKDIQQAPQRSNQKFIEFFDVRHAAAALRAMNRAELSRLPGCSVASSSSAAAVGGAGDGAEGLLAGSTAHHRGSGDGGNFLSPRAMQQQQRPYGSGNHLGSGSNLAAAMQQLGLDGQQQQQQASQVQPIPRPPGFDSVVQMSQQGMVRPVSGMLDRLHAAAVSPPMSLGPLSQSWDTSTGPDSLMLNMRARQQQQQQGSSQQQGPSQQQQQQVTAVQLLQQQQQQHQQQMFLQQALGFLRGSRQDLSTLDRVPETTTPDELQKLLHSSRGPGAFPAGPPSTGGAPQLPVGSNGMHVSDSASSIASTGNLFGAGPAAAAAAAGLLGSGLHGGYHHLQPGQHGFAAAAAAQHPPLVPGSAAAAAAAAAAAVASSQAGGLNRSFGSSDQLHSMEHLAGMGQQQDEAAAAAAAAAAAMMAGGARGLAGNMSANNLAAAAAAAAGFGLGGDGGLTSGVASASFDSGLNLMGGADALHHQAGLGGLLGSHPYLLGAANEAAAAAAAAAAGSGLYPRTAGLGQGGMRSLSHPCLSLSAMAAAAAQVQQQQHQAAQQQSAAAAAAAAAGRVLSQQNAAAAAAMLQAQAAAGLGLQELHQQAQHQQQQQQAQQQLALQHLLQANLQAQSLAAGANLQAAQQLLQAGMHPQQLAAAGLLTPAALASLGLPTSSSYGTLHNLGALQLQSAAAAAAAAGGSGIPRGASSNSLSGIDGRGGHRDGGAGSRGGGRLSRRAADPAVEAERKAQQEKLFALDVERILNGEDKRTTLMVKNIPNKYTQKMLLQTIEEQFKGTFDFFYLPIDFKNKCNVGYAFINMLSPQDIPPLVARFNNKRWDKFNSEKVCNISYGRIQGRAALISHFQNSSLMHEDKRCRPVLFISEGPDAGEPEPFPMGVHVRPRAGASAAGSSGSLAGSQTGGSTAGAAAGSSSGAGQGEGAGGVGSSGSLPGSRNSSSQALAAEAAAGGSSEPLGGSSDTTGAAPPKGPPGL